eukprot:2507199-Prymnesium_polylepis.1
MKRSRKQHALQDGAPLTDGTGIPERKGKVARKAKSKERAVAEGAGTLCDAATVAAKAEGADTLCDECRQPTTRMPCQNPHMGTGVRCGQRLCSQCDEDGHPGDNGFCADCKRSTCGGCFGIRSFDRGMYHDACG